MKILYTSYYFPPDFRGGAEISAYNVAKEMIERGHEIHVLTRQTQADYDSDLTTHPEIRSKELPRELVDISTRKNVDKLLEKEDFDIVHAQSIFTSLGASRATQKHEVPFITSLRGYRLLDAMNLCYNFDPGKEDFNRDIWSTFKRAYNKYKYEKGAKSYLSPIVALYLEQYRRKELREMKKADMMIANSEYIKEKHKYLTDKNIERVYNSIDTELFKPRGSKGSRNQEKVKLLFVGRPKPEKGIETLLKALKQTDSHIELDIVGAEKPSKWVYKAIEQNDVSDKVNYLGRKPFKKLPKYYNNTDIVIFPSEWQEPFGRISIEAMACGKPVIGSEVGGIPETIIDEKTGLLFKPGNAEELAEKITYLAENLDKREELGKEARKRAVKKFSAENIANQQIKTYQKLLD